MADKSRKAILAEERAERIAKQMRDNLRKRKAQKRARGKPIQKEEDIAE